MIINTQIKGAGGSSGKYQVLDRVKDDSNNEIGTVVGFHTDANNTEYAVVALDAVYRLAQGQYLSTNTAVANLPKYSNGGVYGAKETATFNCDKILAQATASGITSTAVSHCRSKTFMVDSVQYAGQLPTLMELLLVMQWRAEVNTADPTATANPTLVVPNNQNMWSSSQYSSPYGWCIGIGGTINGISKAADCFVAPVLEIPNA